MSQARYKIHDQIGEGGAGTVSRAYDSQLKRWVAIKRLLTASESEESNEKFVELQKEANTLASLHNANIVTVFDVGTDEGGLFIVMELLQGPDLNNTLAYGPLSLDDFKELAEQTLEALLAAHERELLHRDIKPQNIKVERIAGGRLQAKIIDFGLAREGLTARKQTEKGGTVMGSIYYMAPEQLSRQPVDQRTDLYSLGCVFYEALSGKKPFDGKTVNEVIDKHLSHELVALETLCPHLPPWLTYWVKRLMAREPTDRPQTSQQAIEEFRAWEKLPSNNTGSMAWNPYMPMAYHTTGQVLHQPYHTTGQVLHQPYHTTGPVLHQSYHTTGHLIPPGGFPSMVPNASGTLPLSKGLKITKQQLPASTKTAEKQQIYKNKLPLILAGAGFSVILLLFFLFNKSSSSDQKSATPATSTKTVVRTGNSAEISADDSAIIFKANESLYPKTRPEPVLSSYRCLHFIGDAGMHTEIAKDSKTLSPLARFKENVRMWQDISPRGDNAPLFNTTEHSPKQYNWPMVFNDSPFTKNDVKCLNFREFSLAQSGNFKSTAHSKNVPYYPFGSNITLRKPGLTLITTFSFKPNYSPQSYLKLSSKNGLNYMHLLLSANNSITVECKIKNQNIVINHLPPQNIYFLPSTVAVTWSKDKVTFYYITIKNKQDRSSKDFAFIPDSPLCDLEISSPVTSYQKPFQGTVGEIVVYSTVLEEHEIQEMLLDMHGYHVKPINEIQFTKYNEERSRIEAAKRQARRQAKQ